MAIAITGCVLSAAPLRAQGVFVRSDCDQSGQINITDPVYLLTYLFLGGTRPACLDACDGDDTEVLNITDAVYILSYLFLGGQTPKAPFPIDDPDPAGTTLTCLNGLYPPDELVVAPESLVFYRLGNAAVLKVQGRFGDGPPEDLRTAQPTRYLSSNPAVCDVQAGILTARAPGSATIEVRFRGAVRRVEVLVAPGAGGAPVVTLTAPPDGAVVTSAAVRLAGRVSDPAASLTLRGKTLANEGGAFATDVDLELGQNLLEVVAAGAGGEGRGRATVTRAEPGSPAAVGPDGEPLPAVLVPVFAPPDAVPPAVAITSPRDAAVLPSAFAGVEGTVDDPAAEVRVNGVLAAVEAGIFRAAVRLPPGAAVVRAEAVDPLGNTGADQVGVTVGAAAPRLAVTQPAGGLNLLAAGAAVTLQGTVSPAGAPVFVNGVPAAVAGAAWSAPLALPSGVHELVVTAAPSGPGAGRAGLVRSLVLDAAPPEVTLAHPGEAALLSAAGFRVDTASVRFSGRLRDALGVPREVEGQLRVIAGGVGGALSGETFRVEVPVAAGMNTITFRAEDARGNVLTRAYKVVRGGDPAPLLEVVSGDLQPATAGAAFAQPLVARALGAGGAPAAGVTATFRFAQGDGVFGGGGRRREVVTGADGRASVQVVAGNQAGSASHVIVASAPGHANSPIAFTLDVLPSAGRVLAAHGRRRRLGEAGRDLPAPLAARVLDDRGNEVAGAQVTFRVLEGGATLGGGSSQTIATAAAGIAAATPRLPAGADSRSVIEATTPGAPAPVRFEVRGLAPGVPADTRLSGVVADERGTAVAGAAVWIEGLPAAERLEAVTDPAGGFALAGAPAGEALLRVEGPPGLGGASRRLETVVGRENTLEAPINLARLTDGARGRSLPVNEATGAVLTLPTLPGLRLDVAAGAARFADGSRSGVITLAAPNLAALPAPPPDDLDVAPAVAILPEGVRFDPPARLTLPNLGSGPGLAGGRAGQALSLYAYAPGAGAFAELAGGAVSDDGGLVSAGPLSGVARSGSFFVAPRGPRAGRTGSLTGEVGLVTPGLRETPERDDSAVAGFNVHVHSGELFLEETDLELPGRGLSYRFRRRYESRHQFRGALGWGWEHEYEDRRLHPTLAGGNIIRASGAGRFDEYLRDAASGRFVSPIGVFATLAADAEGYLVEREPDGTRARYFPLDGSALAGRLESITDRNGNRLRFVRDAAGLIAEAHDPLDRVIVYAHDAAGRITSITDPTGRVARFAYDAAGNLESATGPVVTGTPTGNNFPAGKRSEYVYSSGFADERLNHNLLQVIDPREAAAGRLPRVTTRYGEDPIDPLTFDRVVSQDWGGTNFTGAPAGGTVTFQYESLRGGRDDPLAAAPAASPETADELESFLLAALGVTRVTDQQGRVRAITWSGAGLPLALRVFTAADGIRPRDPLSLHPPPGTSPPYYETRWRWSREGLLRTRIEPRGDRWEHFHDEAAPLRGAQRALLRLEHHPAPAAGGEPGGLELPAAVTTYRRDPLFGDAVETVPPRGNATPDAGGAPEPGRYATRRFLDYQEGGDAAALAASAGVEPGDLAAALQRAGIALGLGDLNGDGDLGGRAGNVVREVPPRATLPDGSLQDAPRTFTYNRFGQVLSETGSDGRALLFEYHPETDPDGDGAVRTGEGLDPSTGGFLARRIVAMGSARVETSFRHDARGWLAERVDPRGNRELFTHNALGQLVEWRLPEPLRYRRHFLYDADDNLVRVRLENYTSLDGGGHFLVSANPWFDTDIEYDILGRPVAVTREVSGGEVGPERSITTRYVYHPAGALARIIHPVPGTDEAFVYDERDLLLRRARGAGTAEEAAWTTLRDENGNAAREIDAADSDGDGAPEELERRWDPLGRLAAEIDAAGGARVFERDIEGNVLEEAFLGSAGGPPPGDRSGAGNVLLDRRSWRYDERGRVTESRRERFAPAGDASGLLPGAPALAPETLVERFWRDAAGRVVRLLDADGGASTREYDAAGRPLLETDPSGNTRRFERDGNGNVVRETVTTVTLEPVQPEAAGDPDYDDAGRFREIATVLRLFDGLDRLTVLVDPAGGVWRARYNSLGKLIFVSDAVGTGINPGTDPELAPLLDLMTPAQRENLNDHGNRRRYLYDDLGRLVEARAELRRGGRGGGEIDVTNPLNSDGIITETFEWDDDGRLAAWTSDPGRRTSIAHDAAGYVAGKEWPGGAAETHGRDRDGLLRSLTDANGSVIEQRFDALGRVVERSIVRAAGVEGTTLQRFERDGLGRVTLAFDDNVPEDPADDALVVRRHDTLGNVLSEVEDGFATAAAHDRRGRVLARLYPEGRLVESPRDAAGNITSLSDRACVYASYRHFGSGRLLEKRLWPGLTLSYLRPDGEGIPRNRGYDVTGEVLEHVYRDPSDQVFHGYEYGRERSGYLLYELPLHRRDGKGDVWRFDSVYRPREYLPEVFDPTTPPIDPLRKLVFYPDGNHSWGLIEVDFDLLRLTINERDQYTEVGDDVLTYDARGNLRTDGNRAYVYDALDRLVRVERAGRPVATYRHDAVDAEAAEDYRGRGRRIAKDVRAPVPDQPAGIVRYLHAGDQVIEERDAAGNLLRQYLHEDAGRPAALTRHTASGSPQTVAFLLDAAGSVTAVVNGLGAIEETVRYSPHGLPQITSSFNVRVSFSRFGNGLFFAGGYHDFEAALHRRGGRAFDPALGRHLTDASPLLPAAPLALNGYLLPGLEGYPGEVMGPGGTRRGAEYLEPFRVPLSARAAGGVEVPPAAGLSAWSLVPGGAQP